MAEQTSRTDATRRDVLKKAAYVVPGVLTLAAAPSFASAGSSSRGWGSRASKQRRATPHAASDSPAGFTTDIESPLAEDRQGGERRHATSNVTRPDARRVD